MRRFRLWTSSDQSGSYAVKRIEAEAWGIGCGGAPSLRWARASARMVAMGRAGNVVLATLVLCGAPGCGDDAAEVAAGTDDAGSTTGTSSGAGETGGDSGSTTGAPPASPPRASAQMAITQDAVFYTDGFEVLRFDRATEMTTPLAAYEGRVPGSQTAYTSMEIEDGRLYWYAQDADSSIKSVSVDGGDARVEVSPIACVGHCFTVDDGQLFHVAGSDADRVASVVRHDLGSGAVTMIESPWAGSITVDAERIYGASCYDMWSVPRGGGEPSLSPFNVGCPGTMLRDGDALLFTRDAEIVRANLDATDLEVVAAETERPGSPFVVRDGVVFAAFGDWKSATQDQIVRIEGSGASPQVLTNAVRVVGLAVDETALFWTERTDDTIALRSLAP